jgi:hypothetical protein
MNTKTNNFQQSGRVKVIKGSILIPQDGGLRFILNVANMAGKVDGPMYPLFAKKWSQVRAEVKGWYAQKTGLYSLDDKKPAALLETPVQSDVWIMSMLCQDDKLKTNVKTLEKCLKEVAKRAKFEHASIAVSTVLIDAIPELSELLNEHLVKHGINVALYEENAVS